MRLEVSEILKNEKIASEIYRLKIEFKAEINPGQFFMLRTLDGAFFLPRPLSVNTADSGKNSVSFLYRLEGAGTRKLSSMRAGEFLQAFGPLGNGFDTNISGSAAIIGGGIGIAPLLFLSQKLGDSADVYLGFKSEIYCVDEFKALAKNVVVATEDGSFGKKGFITDFIEYEKYSAVFTCGPEIMMKKIIDAAKERKIKAFASLERRMACGLGVCLGCIVRTSEGMRRACADGPVFSEAVLL